MPDFEDEVERSPTTWDFGYAVEEQSNDSIVGSSLTTPDGANQLAQEYVNLLIDRYGQVIPNTIAEESVDRYVHAVYRTESNRATTHEELDEVARRIDERYNSSQRWREGRNDQSARNRRELVINEAVEKINKANQNLSHDQQYIQMCPHCLEGIDTFSKDNYKSAEGNIICNSCFSNFFFKCQHCQKDRSRERSRYIETGGMVCFDCFEDYFTPCGRCNVGVDDESEIRNLGNYYQLCANCYNHMENDEDVEYDEDDLFRDYSTKNLEDFMSEDHGNIIQSTRIFSAELETKYVDTDEHLEAMKEIDKAIGCSEDGSISDNGAEFQTPKMKGANGEKKMVKLCDILNNYKYDTDKTCGFHIHLDGGQDFLPQKGARIQEFKGQNLKMLFLFYLVYEEVFHSFLPKSRRRNSYCRPIKENYHFGEIMSCQNLDELERVWYRVHNTAQVKYHKSDKKDDTRYCGMNFHTLLSGNHLEIRYHSGTINSKKILEWINLHCQIMDQVATGSFNLSTISEVQDCVDLKEKTDLFFEQLKLSTSSKKYFLKRQEKFIQKGNFEEKAF